METYSWKKEHLGPILKKNRSFGNLFLKKKDHLGTYSRKIYHLGTFLEKQDHLGIFLRTGRSFGNLFLNKKHLQTYSWKKRAFRSNSYIIRKLILEQKSIWGLIPGKGGSLQTYS